MTDSPHFQHAALGGTFDRLHDGHKAILKKAIQSSNHLSIGVTTESMQKDKVLAQIIQSYEERVAAVKAFILSQNPSCQVSVFPLTDPFGPAISDRTIDCIVVSTKTVGGAEAINAKRQADGLALLAIQVADYVSAQDGSELSSTRVRLGEINRNGFVYQLYLKENAPFVPPVAVRSTLSQPLGDVIAGSDTDTQIAIPEARSYAKNAVFTVGVGDIIAQSFFQANFFPQIIAIDHLNKRQQINQDLPQPADYAVVKTKNQAGRIELLAITDLIDVCHAVQDLDTKQVVVVDGEEDLLVLPLILLIPLTSVVFYGQSGEGIVAVNITEEQKAKTISLLRQSTGQP